MVAYSILKSLFIPPGLLILMLAAAFLLWRSVMARLLLFVATAILALMSIPAVATLLTVPLEPFPALSPDAIPAGAQAILVLSAGRRKDAPEYGGDTLDVVSLERTRYAAFLHKRTGLPVYCSGGTPEDEELPLAVLMERTLRDELGTPVAGIETQSRTTWENAALSRPMLERDGIDHVLLVSSASHLPRAVEAFQQAGIRVTPAPTAFVHRPGWEKELDLHDWLPSAGAFLVSYNALHEHIGSVWYRIKEWAQGAPQTAQVGSAS